LSGGTGRDREEVAQVLQRAGLDPRQRGETLDLEGFAALTRHWAEAMPDPQTDTTFPTTTP
jgi:hypothetical protein